MFTVLFNFKYQLSSISVFVECFITGFVTRVTRRVPLVEQEQLTVPEHLCSRPVISGFRVNRSLFMCMFCRSLFLSLCTFSFGLCVVCSFSIYGLWLPLWYLQILLGSSCQFYVQFLDSLVISAYFCDPLLVDHCAHSRFCWFIILLLYNFYSFYIGF